MADIKEWDRGETARIWNTYTNTAGAAVDPDSITLKIYDPAGVLDTTATYSGDIVKSATGIYYYDYDISADAEIGWWVNKWTAAFGTQEDITKDQFYVRDPEEKLYCTPAMVYARAGQDANFVAEIDVNYFIREAMAEVDSLMGKNYNYSTSATEWFDTTCPNQNTVVTQLFLRYRPIRTITSLEEYDTNADLVETYTSDDYYIDINTGMLGLHTEEFEHQMRRVKIVYTYGYNTIPIKIQQLTTILSAMKVLLNHIGNSVDDTTSFSACGLSMSVGEPYTASARAVEFMTKEKDRIIAAIGRQRQSIFIV